MPRSDWLKRFLLTPLAALFGWAPKSARLEEWIGLDLADGEPYTALTLVDTRTGERHIVDGFHRWKALQTASHEKNDNGQRVIVRMGRLRIYWRSRLASGKSMS